MPTRKKVAVAGSLALSLAVAGFFGGRAVASARDHAPAAFGLVPKGAPAVELHVPRAVGGIFLDGDTDDPGWHDTLLRSGAFVTANGAEAHPYSEMKLTWGDGQLYLLLYAADENLEATHASDSAVWLDDSFHLVFTTKASQEAFDVNPLGAMTDGRREAEGPFDWSWRSGAHVSPDVDEATVNDPRDMDEEWVIEMAVPLESLGLEGEPGERVGFAVHRCDTPKTGGRFCGSFGEAAGGVILVLD